MHAISVKELRGNFPLIRSELKKGESFLLIFKSKPIAELKPLNGGDVNLKLADEYILKDVEKAAAKEWAKLPPITKEENDYYMSLPPYKD